jgi:hypothetical protein
MLNQLSHSNIAISPAPHRSGRRRERCSPYGRNPCFTTHGGWVGCCVPARYVVLPGWWPTVPTGPFPKLGKGPVGTVDHHPGKTASCCDQVPACTVPWLQVDTASRWLVLSRVI